MSKHRRICLPKLLARTSKDVVETTFAPFASTAVYGGASYSGRGDHFEYDGGEQFYEPPLPYAPPPAVMGYPQTRWMVVDPKLNVTPTVLEEGELI